MTGALASILQCNLKFSLVSQYVLLPQARIACMGLGWREAPRNLGFL